MRKSEFDIARARTRTQESAFEVKGDVVFGVPAVQRVHQERLAYVLEADPFSVAERRDGRVLAIPASLPGAEQEHQRRKFRMGLRCHGAEPTTGR